MMHVNKFFFYYSSVWWACYDSAGANGAGFSNIATMLVVVAGDLYMIDPGNETTLGHRRWILSNWLTFTVFGSIKLYSCMAIRSGGGGDNKSWVVWSVVGFYLMEWFDMGWINMNEMGWYIQFDSINLGFV